MRAAGSKQHQTSALLSVSPFSFTTLKFLAAYQERVCRLSHDQTTSKGGQGLQLTTAPQHALASQEERIRAQCFPLQHSSFSFSDHRATTLTFLCTVFTKVRCWTAEITQTSRCTSDNSETHNLQDGSTATFEMAWKATPVGINRPPEGWFVYHRCRAGNPHRSISASLAEGPPKAGLACLVV